MRVGLFVPCYVDQLAPAVAEASVAVLERAGCTVEYDPDQTCCGQPFSNLGLAAEATRLARAHLERFGRHDAVVAPSASCVATVRRHYEALGAGTDPAGRRVRSRTFELSEFLVRELGVTDLGARFPARVTFHDGCHGLRELGKKNEPRELLKKVRGLELIEMTEAEICCGFGGTFAVKFPMISTAMGEVKCASAMQTGADYLVSNDSSCLMHIQGLLNRQGQPIKTMHLAEILAQS